MNMALSHCSTVENGQDRQMLMVGLANGGESVRTVNVWAAQWVSNGIMQYRMSGIRLFKDAVRISGVHNIRRIGSIFARTAQSVPRRRDAAYLQTQLLISQKEESQIQLQAEELIDGCCSRSLMKMRKRITAEIERLQAQLGDQKGKNKDTPCVSYTLDPLPQKLENENVELEYQVSEQKDTTRGTSANTKFAKQSILGKQPSSSRLKLYAVTPLPKSTAFPKNGIFRINPFKASRNDVNSKTNGFSPKDVKSTTRTRRPQPRNNLKSYKVPFKSNTSCLSNKLEKIEENHRSLQSSHYPNHTSSECNNIKLAIRNEKSEVICATCKQCLITANHDDCVLQYVNRVNFRKKNQSANVSKSVNQKKHKAQVWKPKNVGSKERFASPKPSKPRSCLRWSPTGRLFDLKGKIITSSESESQSDCSKGDNACTSNPQEPIRKRFPSSTFSMTGCQNWFDTLLIPLLSEYKSKDKAFHGDNECDT
ncbi:hypothetical protein Tco_0870889 [Tanacetum coccineum]